jgi:hypothetical protein
VRLAASLGLGESVPWRELSRLIEASDPAVSNEDAERYRHARSGALTERFLAGQLLVSPDTPASRELVRLCERGTILHYRAMGLTAARYLSVGTACALLAFFISSRSPLSPPQRQPASPRVPPEPALGSLSQKADVAIPPAPTPILTPYPYPERLARRYYNDARAAHREKRYAVAASLADLAAETGKSTYLLPHALLLRAQIADNLGDSDAPRFWARIASDSPASPYAPLGLLRAAERTKKIYGDQASLAPYLQELFDRYPLSNEARIARGRFTPPVSLSPEKKEEARQ